VVEGPTARVDGLLPPGRAGIESVELFPNQVWSIGRRDRAFLDADPERARWHLGVPDATPDLSVNQLELRVGAVGVAVTSQRGSSVTVDGTIRPSPVVLTSGTSFINPTVSGMHLDFAITVVRSDTYAARPRALAASGTTTLLRISLEPGTAPWRVAHALAWPCMPTRRRPQLIGWSGRDIAERMTQLGWSVSKPGDRNEITLLGKQLIGLANKVANCKLGDGRPAEVVFPHWPPWLDAGEDETRDQKAERRNRCVADVLWRAGAVDPTGIDGAR
jgi:hypothetical protein